MTKQELIANIRAKNPQYSVLPDEVLLNFAVKQKPEFKKILGDISAQQRIERAKNLISESQNQQTNDLTIPQNNHPLRDFGIGFLKGAGRTATGLIEVGSFIGDLPLSATEKITGVKRPEFMQKGLEFNKNITNKMNEKLEPINKGQKIGGYAETMAELLIPVGGALKVTKGARELSTAKKALAMDLKELSKLSVGKFKKIFGIDKGELETVGGVIKSQSKKMPEKLNQLAKEFKDVLQSNKPTKNLKKAQELGKEYWNKTLKLFEGENKTLNEKTIRKYLKDSIEEKISFDSPYQKKEILDKTIEPFMKNIKKGTLQGLEEARAKLSSMSRDATGKLKPAIDELNKAVKNVIRENLSDEKKILYDAYKMKMAKLFDVRDILKAKNIITSGASKLKKTVSAAAKAGGVVAGYEALKRIFK